MNRLFIDCSAPKIFRIVNTTFTIITGNLGVGTKWACPVLLAVDDTFRLNAIRYVSRLNPVNECVYCIKLRNTTTIE